MYYIINIYTYIANSQLTLQFVKVQVLMALQREMYKHNKVSYVM
jgi:hypothetical protein